MRSIILWVHWREQDGDGNINYHMEQVESGMLDKVRDNKEIRTMLRNLEDHALGPRLEGIKEMLPAFWEHFSKSGPAQTTSVASLSVGMENIPALQPSTPSADAREPGRKRKRDENIGDV